MTSRKAPAKRSLVRSLFSRSDAGPKEPAGAEKKQLGFFKFKTKSRSHAERSPNVDACSPAESQAASEHGEALRDASSPSIRRSTLYATAPRSKAMGLSFSELDLRKPKRFSTFSFGLRKRKKDAGGNISKSSVGLHSPGTTEPDEEPTDLSQRELDQVKRRGHLAISQPELDTLDTFDILSPPPIAACPSASHQKAFNNEPERSVEPAMDGSSPSNVHGGMAGAPVAGVPGLHLDGSTMPRPAEERNGVDLQSPNHAFCVPVTPTIQVEPLPAVEAQPSPPSPPMKQGVSDHQTSARDPLPRNSASANGVLVPDGPLKTAEVSPSLDQPDGRCIVMNTPPVIASSPAAGVPKTCSDTTKTARDANAKPSALNTGGLASRNEGSVSHDQKAEPGAISGASRNDRSLCSGETDSLSAGKAAAYGALYDSLFPQSFASEIISAMSDLSYATMTSNSEAAASKGFPPPVSVCGRESFDARRSSHGRAASVAETSIARTSRSVGVTSDLAASKAERAHAVGDSADADVKGRAVTSATLASGAHLGSEELAYESLSDSLLPPNFHQPAACSRLGRPACGVQLVSAKTTSALSSGVEPVGPNLDNTDNRAHSAFRGGSHSAVKPEDFDLVQTPRATAPEIGGSAPPRSGYVTSPGTDCRLSDTRKRVVFFVVTDNLSRVGPEPPICRATTAAATAPGMQFDTAERGAGGLSATRGRVEGGDVLHEPAYISVGSDDSSAVDVYYSAEEDNVEPSEEEEMYEAAKTMEEREVFGYGADLLRPATVKIYKTTEGSEAEKGDSVWSMGIETWDVEDQQVQLNDQIEAQGHGTNRETKTTFQNGTTVFPPLGCGGGEASARARSEIRESTWGKEAEAEFKVDDDEEGREAPTAPVRQVEAAMECHPLAPPSAARYAPREGKGGGWRGDALIFPVTEDQRDSRRTPFPGQETQHPSHKGSCETARKHTDSGGAGTNKRESHRSKEAGEVVGPPAEVEEDKPGAQESGSRGDPVVTPAEVEERPEALPETTGDPISGQTSAVQGISGGSLTGGGGGLQTKPKEFEGDRLTPSCEWADPVVASVTLPRQVPVNLSAAVIDTPRIDAPAERGDRPVAARPTPPHRSLNTPPALRQSLDQLAPQVRQTSEAEPESAEEMNSGVGTLSTTLNAKSTSPREGADESKQRFRKVSLVAETTATTDLSQNAHLGRPSMSGTGSDATDQLPGEYKWRNCFNGVSQYKAEPSALDIVDSQVSLNTYVGASHLSSSALPEATANTRHLPPSAEALSCLGNRLSNRTDYYLSAARGETVWGRSVTEQREESSAPAREQEDQKRREPERIKLDQDSVQLPVSDVSTGRDDSKGSFSHLEDDTFFTGVFTATLVDLDPDPTAPSTSPVPLDVSSPDQPNDMDTLKETLKSMGPSHKQRSLRGNPFPFSSLTPIVEDNPSPTSLTGIAHAKSPLESAEPPNGRYVLSPDLGLQPSTRKDPRSPLDMMKQKQQDQQQGVTRPLRASATNSFGMRTASDLSPDDLPSPLRNGNGLTLSPNTGSRLENSVLFSSYRSASVDAPQESGKGNASVHRSLFRSGSLPESGPSNDRMSMLPKELGGPGNDADLQSSGYDRYSFLLNSPVGAEDSSSRMSRPLSFTSPPSGNSPTSLLSPTSSIDFQRPFANTDSSIFGQAQGNGKVMVMGAGTGSLGTQVLQRSFSNEGIFGGQQTPLFNSVHGGSHFQRQEPEPENTAVPKYRAFPDAYLTKEKEHGKVNPRPGKMFIFDRPGMCGQRIEVRGDVTDATPWELQETISIRVVRGGWVLYERPNFQGERIALDEGDIEITYPFGAPEEGAPQPQNGKPKERGEKIAEKDGEPSEGTGPPRTFVIGSIRRAVRDFSVPEISLFPEENAEGKKVIFRDTSEDARIFGFPIKANSVIVNAGLWLVYAQPFFRGVPRVLEVGGFSNPAAWGVEQPYVGSLHPLKIGEPRVEKLNEPKMLIYDKPYFTGKSRTICTTMKNFMTRTDEQQTAFMYSVGSIKVLGGIWVGFEKEGFRGHQYLLEEGEYHDWRVWGGCDSELRSTRVLRADLTEPLVMMFEEPEEEDVQEENTFEVTEAIADVELFGYKTATRSIHVLSGAWVAYSHVDFSGNQYILEKGFYSNYADWGAHDNRICSVQPILLAPSESPNAKTQILLYSEPNFQGERYVYDHNKEALSDKVLVKSCRLLGGSWVIYEGKDHTGNLYVLSEGEYPNLSSMGCPPSCTIRSLKVIPLLFSIPSISLFGLECLEGKEVTTDMEISNMVEEGFNDHFLSIRVNSGCWVLCEHSNYRGRQLLLETIEIPNWPKFSSMHTIGSMYPVRQRRRFFRIKNQERGHCLSIQGGVEEMKTGRVVVTQEVEGMSDIWFYQDGLIKSKVTPTMSLQVMGNVEPGAKVVLWSETRQPIQTWTAQMRGLITSLTFPGLVLDVKGGKTYDKDHVVIMEESEERPSQRWVVELV